MILQPFRIPKIAVASLLAPARARPADNVHCRLSGRQCHSQLFRWALITKGRSARL